MKCERPDVTEIKTPMVTESWLVIMYILFLSNITFVIQVDKVTTKYVLHIARIWSSREDVVSREDSLSHNKYYIKSFYYTRREKRTFVVCAALHMTKIAFTDRLRTFILLIRYLRNAFDSRRRKNRYQIGHTNHLALKPKMNSISIFLLFA